MHPDLLNAFVQMCRDHQNGGDRVGPIAMTDEQLVNVVVALADRLAATPAQPVTPVAMWERFVAKLNELQPLRSGQHVAMLGSLDSYKQIFLEANK